MPPPKRILFDHGTPRGIARALPEHTVLTAYAQGWDQLNNGALLHTAEDAAIDVLLTTDQRIRYQQNLAGRRIALVVLTGTTKWTRVPSAANVTVERGKAVDLRPLRLAKPP